MQSSVYAQKLSFSTLRTATVGFLWFGRQTEIANAKTEPEHQTAMMLWMQHLLGGDRPLRAPNPSPDRGQSAWLNGEINGLPFSSYLHFFPIWNIISPPCFMAHSAECLFVHITKGKSSCSLAGRDWSQTSLLFAASSKGATEEQLQALLSGTRDRSWKTLKFCQQYNASFQSVSYCVTRSNTITHCGKSLRSFNSDADYLFNLDACLWLVNLTSCWVFIQ